MARTGKCLTCGALMPWGTPVCPQCKRQLRWPGIAPRRGINPIATILVVAGIVLAGRQLWNNTQHGSSAHYNVAISGTMPRFETVGMPVTLSINARNRGSRLPHLVLAFDGLGSWVINDVTGCNGTAHALDGFGNPYDFGPIPMGATCQIVLDLNPTRAGNPRIVETTYGNVDQDNTVDTGASVDDNAAAVQWDVVINPS